MKTEISQDKVFGVEMWMIKIFIVPGILLIGFLASLFMVFIPKINEVGQYRTQIKRNKDQVKQIKAKTAYLISVDQEEVKRNAEQLNMALLGNKDAYFLVNVVKDVAGKFGFAVESFSISPGEFGDTAEPEKKTVSKLGMETIPVKVMLVGPETSYVNLISAIERSLPIMSVSQVEMKVRNGLAELDMTVATNFSPDPTDFKIGSLTMADLTLKDEEMKLIEELGQYQKIAGASADEDGLVRKGEFVKYDRQEPFGM